MSLTLRTLLAPSPSTTRGSPTPISAHTKGTHITYCANKTIYVRSIDSPSDCKQYTAHTAAPTIARFSPSSFYIASGDTSGTVKIWDSVGCENTKGSYEVIAGRIRDVAWDGDSARIIAVGDGRERYGACITADSGNSVGEISGHAGQVNCVDVRKQRPIRAVTGSDDASLCWYHGVPFKYQTNVRGRHEKYVLGVQFSPDGERFVSVGSDRKIWVFDGKTGEVVKEVGKGVHTGSVFGVSWAPDSKRFVTCSGDRTVRVWDAESGECTRSWRMGGEKGAVGDQQVGVVWVPGRQDGMIISIDLDGNLNYFCEGREEGPVMTVSGHAKAITAAVAVPGSGKIWTASSDGRTLVWDLKNEVAYPIAGEGHTSYVSGLAATSDGSAVSSIGWDDTLRSISTSESSFASSPAKTNGQPKAIASTTIDSKPYTLISDNRGITLYSSSAELSHLPLSTAPTSLSALGPLIAAASSTSPSITLYTLTPTLNPALTPITTLLSLPSNPTTLAVSPQSTRLAAGLANGKILVYRAPTSRNPEWELETNRWSAHSGRVNSIAWSADGRFAVSGGLDTNVFVWSLEDPGRRVKALNAHKEGVGAVCWTAEGECVSCGVDGAVKVWDVR
ncbi:WD40 repeat-like protein [Oleoguttula sp. CCFEE 5521]